MACSVYSDAIEHMFRGQMTSVMAVEHVLCLPTMFYSPTLRNELQDRFCILNDFVDPAMYVFSFRQITDKIFVDQKQINKWSLVTCNNGCNGT